MFKGEFFHNTPADGAFYEYQIEQSARFDSASSSYLTQNFSSEGNKRTGTFSAWVKRVTPGTQHLIFNAHVSNANQDQVFGFTSNDYAHVWMSGGTYGYQTSDGKYRDTTGWSHFVAAWDSTQGTAANRIKMYLNGTQLTTANDSPTQPNQNHDFFIFDDVEHNIGRRGAYGGQHYYDGYLAEVIGVDGTQYAPSQFGEEKNGVWIPKDPSGTSFGTNGFHLKFDNDGVGIVPSSISSAGTHAASGSNMIGLFGNVGAATAPSNYSQSGQSDLSFTVDLGSAKTVGAWLGAGHQQSGYATRTATGTVSHSDNNSDFTSVGSSTYTFANGTAPNGHTWTPSSHRYWKLSFPSASGGDGTSGYQLSAFYMQAAQSTSIADLGVDSSGNDNNFTVNNMGGDHQVLDSPTFGS